MGPSRCHELRRCASPGPAGHINNSKLPPKVMGKPELLLIEGSRAEAEQTPSYLKQDPVMSLFCPLGS